MRIVMFIFVGIALGDKLDRTYLPPPGSKFAGGSPGALETPLEYPKETYPTPGGIGQNAGTPFVSNQRPSEGQQFQQRLSAKSQGPKGGDTFIPDRQFQQFSQQGLAPTSGQPAFGSNQQPQQPPDFSPSGSQNVNARPTFGPNQSISNLQPAQTTGMQYPNDEQAFGINQSPSSVPQGFIPPNQQRPNAGQTFGQNQGQPQLDSQGFIQRGQLPDYQQYIPGSSTQSPLNTYQGNVPSTTTTYAYTQTTISPFDDIPGTAPPFGFDGQQGFNIPVQVNYPQSGFTPGQSPASRPGQQPQSNLPISQQGITSGQIGQFTPQGSLPGQTYNQGQNQGYNAPNQPGVYESQDVRNRLQQENYNQQIPNGPVSTQQTSIYPESGSSLGTPQSNEPTSSYRPSEGSVFQQNAATTPGTLSQSEGQFGNFPSSTYPERRPQNQYQGIDNSDRAYQQTPQNQYTTPTSQTQRFPQRPNQYQNENQFGPVISTTASPFDQIYSTPGNQNIDGTQKQPGFTTPGFSQPSTPGSFVSSTASSISPDVFSPSTPSYPAGQTQLNYGQNRPERVQAEADRNAVILNYENNLTPEGEFNYSFDTSNGIHADENGTSIDGVRAQGSFSYTGDDGKVYSVTYSADENGFVPMGDHLPTPPPIPDAIKRVIEQAMRDKEAGIFNDGSYDEARYGHKKYKGNTQKYKPTTTSKKNRINAKQGGTIGTEELDNGDRDVDYETLEDEIEDIKLGNKKPAYFDKNDSIHSTTDTFMTDKPEYGTKKPLKRPTISNTAQKFASQNKNIDTGYETDDEEITKIIPKTDSRRPSNKPYDNTSFDKDVDNEEKTYESKTYSKPMKPSDRRRPDYGTTEAAEDEYPDDEKENVNTQIKSNRRKPNVEISTAGATDPDVETDDNDTTDDTNTNSSKSSKRPKPFDRRRPGTTISKVDHDESETEKPTSRPKSSKDERKRPSYSSKKDFDEDDSDETAYQTGTTPKGSQSLRVNKKRPDSNVSGETEGDNEDEFEMAKSPKRPFDRRRPGFSTPDTDEDFDIPEAKEDKKVLKSRPENRNRPTTSQISTQNYEMKYKNKKPSKRPDSDEDIEEESIEEDFEGNAPLKRPQFNVVQSTDSFTQDEKYEPDYDKKKPTKKLESTRRRPETNGKVEESSSRKPVNRRPGVTIGSTDKPFAETDNPSEDGFETAQPYEDIFGDRDETSSKLDKRPQSKRPSGTKKQPSSIFEVPEKEDDYDYSLNEETEDSGIPTNKKPKPQQKNPIDIPVEEYEGEDENDDDSFKKPTGGSSKISKQRQKITKPAQYPGETSAKDDSTETTFESATSSTQRYPYSTRKPFTKDGDKGYQYLPPQNKFNEQPGRVPAGQNDEVRQPNQGFIDRKRPSGFQATSGPSLQSQFDGNLPENYDENGSEQNTPNDFAGSKIEPQTTYETGSTRRPSYSQTNQRIPSQSTQKYPVTERNRYQTPGSTPAGFSTTPTPGFMSTYGSTPGNVFGDRFSTTAKPFGPSQLNNKNYYSEARPTYLPTTEKPFGNELNQQRYSSGNLPSTTYRPNLMTTVGSNYGPNFRPNQQNQSTPQNPIYGPDSTSNVYTNDGSTYQANIPGSSQISSFSSTENPPEFDPTSLDQQGNRQKDVGYVPQMFGPAETNRVVGEDFSGPKRPQSFDPNTGYHY